MVCLQLFPAISCLCRVLSRVTQVEHYMHLLIYYILNIVCTAQNSTERKKERKLLTVSSFMSTTDIQSNLLLHQTKLDVCGRHLQQCTSSFSSFDFDIGRVNSSSGCGFVLCTCPFRWPQRRKSMGDKSGNLGDHKRFENHTVLKIPFQEIHRFARCLAGGTIFLNPAVALILFQH